MKGQTTFNKVFCNKICTSKVFDKNSTNFYKRHVIVHSERFQFPKDGHEITSSRERESFMCPTIDCMLSRYPYFKLKLLSYSPSISATEKQVFGRDLNV